MTMLFSFIELMSNYDTTIALWRVSQHWNENVVNQMNVSSLAALEIVMVMISGTASEQIQQPFFFQCND